jgi:hypothetical protein
MTPYDKIYQENFRMKYQVFFKDWFDYNRVIESDSMTYIKEGRFYRFDTKEIVELDICFIVERARDGNIINMYNPNK